MINKVHPQSAGPGTAQGRDRHNGQIDDITAIMTHADDEENIIAPKERPLPQSYSGNGQWAIHQPPRSRLLRKYLSGLLVKQMRLPELIKEYWSDKRTKTQTTSALETDALTYANELDWALSSEPTVEAAIR